ncbi:hypothetical protein pb186bvf_014349 [Paramecium bursaria]
MGNACKQNRNDPNLQIRESRGYKADTLDTYIDRQRSSVKNQKKLKKQKSKQFGDQLIEELMLIIKSIDINDDWKQLTDIDTLKIYGYQWQKEEKNMQFLFEHFSQNQYNQGSQRQNKKIEQFEIIQDTKEFDESMRYIAFKGIMIQSSRDFVYLKKSIFKKDVIIEVFQSVEDTRFTPQKGRTRGNINLFGYIIQQQDDNAIIDLYCDVDLKMNLTLQSTQQHIIREVKTFLCD